MKKIILLPILVTLLLVSLGVARDIQDLTGGWIKACSTDDHYKNEDFYFDVKVGEREAIMYRTVKKDFHVGPRYFEEGTKIEHMRFRLDGRKIIGSFDLEPGVRGLITGLVSEDGNEINVGFCDNSGDFVHWFFETYRRKLPDSK